MRKLLLLGLFFAGSANAALSVDNCSTPTSTGGVTSIEVTASTHNDGDLLIIFASMNDNTTVVLDETGWTVIDVIDDDTLGDKSVGAWYRIASSESGTYTITDDGITNHAFNGAMCTITGFDSGNVEDATNTTSTGTGDSDTHDPAAITTVTNNAFVFTVLVAVQSGGSGITQPSGHTKSIDTAVSATNLGVSYIDAGTAEPEDPGTWSGLTSTADSASITFAIRPSVASAPTFTSNPTLDACTATGCTFDYTADASGDTLYAMFTDTAASAPTCDAIELTTGSHGDANESTTGSADSITITSTDAPEFPIYDAHFCIEDSGGLDSSVVTVSDNTLSDPTGEQFIAITSIGSGSPCESFNTAVDPDIASGDYLLANDTTDPGAYTITIGADCQFSYSGDSSRQSVLNIEVFDQSAGDYHASDIDFWANNSAPVCDAEFVQAFDIDEAITNIIIAGADGELCTDADEDTLTITLTSGTLPTGISQGGTGNGTLSGTPTVENESGATLVFTATDVAGDTDTQDMVLYPIDTITMPTLTGGDLGASIDTEFASFPWRVDPEQVVTFKCDSAASQQVISQTPAASTEVEWDAAISITASTGPLCAFRRYRD